MKRESRKTCLQTKNSCQPPKLHLHFAMPTYVYETIPGKKGQRPKRFEIRHSIADSALTKHPETGEPIRRVITGGAAVLTSSAGLSKSSGHGHSASCGCGVSGCAR